MEGKMKGLEKDKNKLRAEIDQMRVSEGDEMSLDAQMNEQESYGDSLLDSINKEKEEMEAQKVQMEADSSK